MITLNMVHCSSYAGDPDVILLSSSVASSKVPAASRVTSGLKPFFQDPSCVVTFKENVVCTLMFFAA